MEKIDHAPALNGDAAEMRAAIRKIDIPRSGGLQPGGAILRSPFLGKTKMSIQPRQIFFRARRIDHEKKSLVTDSVSDEVVDDSTTLIEEKCVLSVAEPQLVDVVGQHRVQPPGSRWTTQN